MVECQWLSEISLQRLCPTQHYELLASDSPSRAVPNKKKATLVNIMINDDIDRHYCLNDQRLRSLTTQKNAGGDFTRRRDFEEDMSRVEIRTLVIRRT